MGALDLEVVFDKLKEQGWVVERTHRGHWKAIPSDKGKSIVHISQMAGARSLKNAIADLKRSGFVWEENPRSRRQLEAIPEAIPEPPLSATELRQLEPFGAALRRLRQAEDMETSLVAGLLDVTTQAVGAWEHGINTPIREHYDLLLELFPMLACAPQPDIRDVPKPDGGRGIQRASFDSFTQPLETLSPVFFPDVSTDPLPQEIYAMNQPQPAAPITNVTNKSLIVKFVKIVSTLKEDNDVNLTIALLEHARDAGMSIDDLLEMLA